MAERTVYIIDLSDKVSAKLDAVKKKGKETDDVFTDINKTLGTLGIGVGVASLFELGKGIYDITSAAEQSKIKFEVMLGSVGKAGKMIADIRDEAARTPFETTDLEQAATTLLGFGIAGEDIMPTMKMLGDISAGNAEKFQRVTLAFAQISAAGRLTGQDLLQLINAGFNPLQTISEQTGIKLSDLKEKMEDGLISFDMVKAAFETETSEGGRFFQMMEKQAQTLDGRLSTLRDKVKMIGLEIGETASGGMSNFIDIATGIVETIQNTAWTDFFQVWKDFADSLMPASSSFSDILNALGLGSELGLSFQHVIDGITVSIRLLLLPLNMTIDAVSLLVEIVKSAAIATSRLVSGDIEGAGEAFSGVSGKWDDFKSNFTDMLSFDGGRGFGEAKIKKSAESEGWTWKEIFAPVTDKVDDIKSMFGFAPEKTGVNSVYNDLFTDKSKDKGKSRKQTAGGLTLNESKNGSTVITFNIDTFQKNEFTKDGSTLSGAVKDILDQMNQALTTVINDSAIVAKG